MSVVDEVERVKKKKFLKCLRSAPRLLPRSAPHPVVEPSSPKRVKSSKTPELTATVLLHTLTGAIYNHHPILVEAFKEPYPTRSMTSMLMDLLEIPSDQKAQKAEEIANLVGDHIDPKQYE